MDFKHGELSSKSSPILSPLGSSGDFIKFFQ